MQTNIIPENSEIGLRLALEERNNQVHGVGKIKRMHGKALLDQSRWKIVVENVKKMGEEKGIESVVFTKVWEAIHEVSLKIEELVPPISEIEQSNDDEAYNTKLLPIREKIDALNARILDSIGKIIKSKSDDVSGEIISIVQTTGRESILKYLEVLLYDKQQDFSFLLKAFKNSLNTDMENVRTLLKISSALFDKWANGESIPSEKKREEVIEVLQTYITMKKI